MPDLFYTDEVQKVRTTKMPSTFAVNANTIVSNHFSPKWFVGVAAQKEESCMSRTKAPTVSDVYTSALKTAGTAMRVWETMVASQAVIQSRLGTIHSAARNPATADYDELALMVPEKVKAFSKAGAAALPDLQLVQSMYFAQAHHLTKLMLGYKVPSIGDLSAIAARSTQMAIVAADAAGKALLPVHAQATSNARRLKKPPGK